MLQWIVSDHAAQRAIGEVLKEIPGAKDLTGTFTCRAGGTGYEIGFRGGNGTVRYGDRRSLMRAVSVIAERGCAEDYTVSEVPAYGTLCAMPDVSRNAVLTVESVKRLCRLLAAEGYSSLMLYTEDTYELPGYPYFGHLRGRYSKEELREIENYADLMGLEMIPCIQTLAHLNGFFEWPDSAKYGDVNDILLVGDEKVYDMIDAMLGTMEQTLKCRKIHIGLDEAFLLGCGRYLDKFGYTERSRIMLNHLRRVAELCKKHGFKPRMWSDMFFRILNHGVYRVPGTVIPPEVAESVPENVVLVYWDYTQPDEASYNEMFRQHRAFGNPIAFAGGDASWYGLAPLNRMSANCADAAAASLRTNGIREVYVTMWKDDGAACSFFSSMNTLFRYGEACWQPVGEKTEFDRRVDKRLEVLTGIGEAEYLLAEEINHLPGREKYGKVPSNPNKYIFYENILTGKFDRHIPDGSEEHYRNLLPVLQKAEENAGRNAYWFRPLTALCRVLAKKAEMGKRLYQSYGSGDRGAVEAIRGEIPELKQAIRDFRLALRDQWFNENKTFGFDVMDIRIGGLLAQLDSAEAILGEWLAGEREKIGELECPRLPYGLTSEKGYDNGILLVNRWERIAGQNISNMFM